MKRSLFVLAIWLNFSPVFGLDQLTAMIDQNLDQVQASSELKEFWGQLKTTHLVENKGKDQEFRHKYVGLQGVVEATLADSKFDVVGVIHTALPPTPLRTQGQVMAEGLITKDIANDPLRLKTVLDRVNILRTYLDKGKKLFACYPQPQGDVSIPGIDVYRQEISHYSNLIDMPFIGELPKELSGATYIIKDGNGHTYCFGILARQASAPDDDAHWVMIYGPASNGVVQRHVDKIIDFLSEKQIFLN
jgi:hypothetical protein